MVERAKRLGIFFCRPFVPNPHHPKVHKARPPSREGNITPDRLVRHSCFARRAVLPISGEEAKQTSEV